MAAEAANAHAELVPPLESPGGVRTTSTGSNSIFHPVSWFSSLWTLQEAILCPDLHLYTRDWRRLEDRNGSAITMSALMACIRVTEDFVCSSSPIDIPMHDPSYYLRMQAKEYKRTPGDEKKVPLGAKTLQKLSLLSRLDVVLATPSPSRVFLNASIRACTDSRAPGIMSALGVTEWYSKRIKQKKRILVSREELVLNTYPLSFVREAFQKFGAILLDGQWAEDWRLSAFDVITRVVARGAYGSMLPFAYRHDWYSDKLSLEDRVRISIVDHESVKTWKIHNDGSIRVLSAGICTSSQAIDEAKIMASITWMNERPGGERSLKHTTDLRSKLREIAGSEIVYAVSLYRDGNEQQGVLLQSPRTTLFGRSYLMKIGYYTIFQKREMPPSTKVNWVVL